jgi:hypothetical protein
MTKSLWFFGAFAVVLGATFVPLIGADILAPGAALGIGVAAAWWLLRTPGHTVTQATALAAIAGAGALVASVMAFVLLGTVLGNMPAIQELIRNSEPHPEARVPYEWIPGLAAGLGGLVGLGIGIVNLLLATLGGLIGALVISPQRRGVQDAIG